MRTVVAWALVTSLLATLSACTTTPYPASWAAVDTPPAAAQCKEIVGAFSQFGRETHEGLIGKARVSNARLASILFPALQPSPITHVAVRFSAANPGAVAWVGEETLARWEPRADELRCEGGVWRLDEGWSTGGSGAGLAIPAFGAAKAAREFRLASDGALIVKETERVAGVVALVPFTFSNQSWFRFPAATPVERVAGPTAPQGVLAIDSPYARLVPPAAIRQAGRGEQHRVSEQCLKASLAQAGHSGQLEHGAARAEVGDGARLAGRPVQAFLFQDREGALPHLRRQWLDRDRGHVLSTKTSRLLKPHWLDPRIAERTVLCMLDAGYVWETMNAPPETRFDDRDR